MNLLAPRFADPAQQNLSGAGTSLVFTTAPVTDEPPGTYTAGLWVKTRDDVQQALVLADVQIATAAPEPYATGTSATCDACHRGPASGKSYLAHVAPGYSPVGNWALDDAPIASCKLCHNADGYSVHPIVRKVHAIHRGSSQLAPGVAHPEYGSSPDPSLASFISEPFPSMPGADRDCARCHVTGTDATAPARLACGSCHDNLFFDTGALVPPRDFGKPLVGGIRTSCTQTADCAAFSPLATCDGGTGACLQAWHPPQPDDAQCAECHTPGAIAAQHDIPQRTQASAFSLSGVTVSGATGPNGAFVVGDVPVVSFSLLDGSGSPIASFLTDATWSGNAIVSGPNEAPQRVWPMTSVKTRTVWDAAAQAYTFTFPSPWPVSALAPLDTPAGTAAQPNVAGSYTLWLYVYRTSQPTPNPRDLVWRNTADFSTVLRFGEDGPRQARQVIAKAACDACHAVTQAHGGSRQDASLCFTCHTRGAEDKGLVGMRGAACTVASQAVACAGYAFGTESCQDTNNDLVPDACVTTADPTPGQSIEASVLFHQLHFARKLEGWAERDNVPFAGRLEVNLADLSGNLLPQDVRNCTKCHADQGGTCSAARPCGIGQACQAGTCVNTSYTAPSTRVCLSCHDSSAAYAHAALETYQDASGPIESCDVCHGPDAAFAVSVVHAIANPYVPPYPRE